MMRSDSYTAVNSGEMVIVGYTDWGLKTKWCEGVAYVCVSVCVKRGGVGWKYKGTHIDTERDRCTYSNIYDIMNPGYSTC